MSNADKSIDPAEHARQIAAYADERPRYEVYAELLKRLLDRARAAAIPEAVIEVRAKTLSSFAEKCVRRFDRYPDAINDFTDLCGARVIVQTLAQVQAVCAFIEANFEVQERDDKAEHLADNVFGYRDTHFIIRLKADGAEHLGIASAELEKIGKRRAEIQVRTWLQHAWADALHDRIYKSSLQHSHALQRGGNLLAALLEEGDRNVDQMARELDGMIANYTAYATRADAEREIDIQRMILKNEPDQGKKPLLALKLARLIEARGDYAGVTKLLKADIDQPDDGRTTRLEIYGHALCRKDAKTPNSEEFQRGSRYLEMALAAFEQFDSRLVIDPRKRSAGRARVLSRLGWAYDREQRVPEAAKCYLAAHEQEPENPYYLTDMLGYELYRTQQSHLPRTLRPALRAALDTSRDHAERGIELPRAYFTAGRLALLLQDRAALGLHALGVRHYLSGEQSCPGEILDEEVRWLQRLHFGQERIPQNCQDLLDLLDLARRVPATPAATGPRVLIVAGGAASLTPAGLEQARPLLREALAAFSGLVISGGTRSGIPGLTGEIIAALRAEGRKNHELVGYIPTHLPQDGPKDEDRYDHFVVQGDSFGPEQILRCWRDLLDVGTHPAEVTVLGFGGGSLSAVEYHVALALGAEVGVLAESGGAAQAILKDSLWAGLPRLLPLPADLATFWAYLRQPSPAFDAGLFDAMAAEIHRRYCADTMKALPEKLRPWDAEPPKWSLPETYKRANREQARFAIEILESRGFGVRPAETPGAPVLFDFTPQELQAVVECLAEREHGRWNVERLRDGWRPGPRDDALKRHDCLLPWQPLPEDIKHWDRLAVKSFPAILAKAGLEVYRKAV